MAESRRGRAVPAGDSTVPDLLDPGGTLDFAGAIYGSLLAAATIVGLGASTTATTTAPYLVGALVGTSLVFWLLHVHVRVVGHEMPQGVPLGDAVRESARHELPILLAVVPPTVATVVAAMAGVSGTRMGWIAMLTALVGLVLATWLAVRRVLPNRREAVVSVLISTALGLVLVALKVVLAH